MPESGSAKPNDPPPYAYVGNQPTNLVDPSGMFSQAPSLLWNQDQLSQIEDCWIDGGELFFAEQVGEANGCGAFVFGGCAISWMWEPVCEYKDEIITVIDTVASVLPGFDCLSAVTWDRTAARAAFCLADLLPGSDVLKYGGRYGDELTQLLFRRGDEFVAAGRHSDELAEAAARACGLLSFSPDTPVVLADGSHRSIAEIEPGDYVVSADPLTRETGPRQVTAIRPHVDQLAQLVLDGGGTIETTEDHPFWSSTDNRWQQAQHLDQGDRLYSRDGAPVSATGVAWPASDPTTSSREVEGVWGAYGQGAIQYSITISDDSTVELFWPGGNTLECMGVIARIGEPDSCGTVMHVASTCEDDRNGIQEGPVVIRLDAGGDTLKLLTVPGGFRSPEDGPGDPVADDCAEAMTANDPGAPVSGCVFRRPE